MGEGLRERVNLEDRNIRIYEGRLFSVNNLQSFSVIADREADPQSQDISKTNQPSPQPSAMGEGAKPTYSPINLFTYSPYKKSAFTLAEGATHVALPDNQPRYAFTLAVAPTHVAHFDNTRRAAFTLAEVLITLGIIGVVAAMTISVLYTQYKDMVLKQQFKKAYSIIQQAYQDVYADAGYNYECYYWDKRPYPDMSADEQKPSDYTGRFGECSEFTSNIEKHLNIIKKCEKNALQEGCIPRYIGGDTYYKQQDENLSDEEALQKADGCRSWTQSNLENNCTAYVLSDGTIILLYGRTFKLFAVDINGMKGPNKWGHDLFVFNTVGNINKPAIPTYGGCNIVEKGGRPTLTMLTYIYQ